MPIGIGMLVKGIEAAAESAEAAEAAAEAVEAGLKPSVGLVQSEIYQQALAKGLEDIPQHLRSRVRPDGSLAQRLVRQTLEQEAMRTLEQGELLEELAASAEDQLDADPLGQPTGEGPAFRLETTLGGRAADHFKKEGHRLTKRAELLEEAALEHTNYLDRMELKDAAGAAQEEAAVLEKKAQVTDAVGSAENAARRGALSVHNQQTHTT